ncbi:hypothetical protein ACJX0J_025783 [Zea mays]
MYRRKPSETEASVYCTRMGFMAYHKEACMLLDTLIKISEDTGQNYIGGYFFATRDQIPNPDTFGAILKKIYFTNTLLLSNEYHKHDKILSILIQEQLII